MVFEKTFLSTLDTGFCDDVVNYDRREEKVKGKKLHLQLVVLYFDARDEQRENRIS